MTESLHDYIARHEGKCSTKRRFYTLKDARDFGKRMKKKAGKRQHPYECRFCGYYHLTTLSLTENIRVAESLGSVLRQEEDG